MPCNSAHMYIRETTHIINIQMSKLSIFYNILCASKQASIISFNWNKCIHFVSPHVRLYATHIKIASQIDLKVISHHCISPEYENAVCHFSSVVMLVYFLVSFLLLLDDISFESLMYHL